MMTSPCQMVPLRGARVSRTPVKRSIFAEDIFLCSTLIIVVSRHPATTSIWFSSRNRRHTTTTSRFPNTTLPSSPSRIPRATTTTATRFPWCYPTGFRPFAASWHPASSASRTPTLTLWLRTAPRRVHSRTSGALQQSPASASGLLPPPQGHTYCSDLGISYPRTCCHITSACCARSSDSNGVRRGTAT